MFHYSAFVVEATPSHSRGELGLHDIGAFFDISILVVRSSIWIYILIFRFCDDTWYKQHIYDIRPICGKTRETHFLKRIWSISAKVGVCLQASFSAQKPS